MALILAGIAGAQPALAQPAVNVLSLSADSQLIEDLYVVRDPSRSLRAQDVAQQTERANAVRTQSLSLGFTSDAVWVVFRLARQNESSPRKWWIEVEQPLFLDVVLYEQSSDGSLVPSTGHLPNELREHAFDYRIPTFQVTLSDLAPKTYYLRVVTKTSMSAAIRVWQPQAFVKHHANSRFVWGGVYGAFLLIVLFYGLWWIWTRERLHLVYTLYVSVNLMASFFSAAWPRQLFPGMEEETFLVWTGLWISLSAPVAAYFTFEILHFRAGPLQWVPIWVKRASVLMFVISMVLVVSGRYGTAMPLVQFYALNLILMSVVLAAWRSLRGDRSAQFFLMAFGIFYVGVAWRFLKNIGWVEPNFWSTNAYQIGAFSHMMIMSVSVFANYSRLRKEKQQVEFRLQAESQRRQEQATFLGMVSHEFRTPLSIIASTGDNLLADQGLSDQARSRVEKILRANKRLSALMDEYLSYERLMADAVSQSHDAFDLSQVARRIVAESTDADGPAVELNVSGPAMVRGDPELLGVALHNLVNNARRHSPAQGVVMVRVAWQGGQIEVSVEDQGPGVSDSDREKIFDKFFRGTNALSKPGAGMGLYLVKSIVEHHAGVVEQHNLVPQGCQFVIRLPAC